MYWITLYDNNDIEVWTRRYDTKSEQMRAYHELRAEGYPESRIERGKYSE
jgi:hypothetical protein